MFPREFSQWSVSVRDVRVSEDGTAVLWKRHNLPSESTDHRDVFLDLRLMTSTKAVTETVENHGPLWLCEHGLPYSHSFSAGRALNFKEGKEFSRDRCFPLGYDELTGNFVPKTNAIGLLPIEEEFADPVESWLDLANQSRLFMKVLRAIRHPDRKELIDEARRRPIFLSFSSPPV